MAVPVVAQEDGEVDLALPLAVDPWFEGQGAIGVVDGYTIGLSYGHKLDTPSDGSAIPEECSYSPRRSAPDSPGGTEPRAR